MTAVAAKNDELTVALIELDAAWEANSQMKATLEGAKRELAAFRRSRYALDPKLHAFEKVATALWLWENGDDVSQRMTLAKIDGIIREARAQMEAIVKAQREKEAA